jgi:hypothetical protein
VQVYDTIFIMYPLDLFGIAARPQYIVVEFRNVCCSRKLWSGNVAQRVEEEIF